MRPISLIHASNFKVNGEVIVKRTLSYYAENMSSLRRRRIGLLCFLPHQNRWFPIFKATLNTVWERAVMLKVPLATNSRNKGFSRLYFGENSITPYKKYLTGSRHHNFAISPNGVYCLTTSQCSICRLPSCETCFIRSTSLWRGHFSE